MPKLRCTCLGLRRRRGWFVWGVAWAGVLLQSLSAQAFRLDQNRWTHTALSGTGTSQGSPAIVTWSLVPDGTSIPGKPWLRPTESSDSSSLVAFFDGLYGDGGGGSLSSRPWFYIFDDAASRWSELSGVTFVYEPNDDGAPLYTIPNPNNAFDGPGGEQGVRGDVRIGAHYIDGEAGANTLGYSAFANSADMVLDTGNPTHFGNLSSGSLLARNTIMHELGHGLGIRHLDSSDAAFLMEANITAAFDGPQLDDILAIQRWYGDVYEKSNNQMGNDTPEHATPLGTLYQGGSLAIGTDAATTYVGPGAIDFVSIDDDSDIDFFRFELHEPGTISLTLLPHGPSYMEGMQNGGQTLYETSKLNDLALDLFRSDGTTLIASANLNGLGGTEALNDVELSDAGSYFVRVTGSENQIQLYELQIDFPAAGILMGDVNRDGVLDFSGNPATDDLLAFIAGWKTVTAEDDDITAWQKGDLNLDRVSDLRDAFLMRKALLAAGASQRVGALTQLGSTSVPEPSAWLMVLGLLGVAAARGRRVHS